MLQVRTWTRYCTGRFHLHILIWIFYNERSWLCGVVTRSGTYKYSCLTSSCWNPWDSKRYINQLSFTVKIVFHSQKGGEILLSLVWDFKWSKKVTDIYIYMRFCSFPQAQWWSHASSTESRNTCLKSFYILQYKLSPKVRNFKSRFPERQHFTHQNFSLFQSKNSQKHSAR